MSEEPNTVDPPKAGEVRKGYRFKGGNPNDKANWEPASTPSPMPKAGEVRKGYRFNGGDPNDKANWEPESSFQQAPPPMTTPLPGAAGGASSTAWDTLLAPSSGTPTPPYLGSGPATPKPSMVAMPEMPVALSALPESLDFPTEGEAKTLAAVNKVADRVRANKEYERDVIIPQRQERALAITDNSFIPDDPQRYTYLNAQQPQPASATLASSPVDPRAVKAEEDYWKFVNATGERSTQFSREERFQRIKAGAWTPKQQQRYELDILKHQQDVLAGRSMRVNKLIGEGVDRDILAAEMQDIDAGEQYVKERMADVAKRDPLTFADKLREAKQIATDAVSPKGDSQVRQFLKGNAQMLTSAVGGALKILDPSDNYTLADRFADAMNDVYAEYDSGIRTKAKEGFVHRDPSGQRRYSLEGLGGILSQGAGSMLAMIGTGAAAGGNAVLGTSYLQGYNDFIDNAEKEGVKREDIDGIGMAYGVVYAAAERFINPQLLKAGMPAASKRFLDTIKAGGSVKEGTKAFVAGGGKEFGEEMTQGIAEAAANRAVNSMTGSSLDDDITVEDGVNTAISTLLLGGIAEVGMNPNLGKSSAKAQALAWATQNPQAATEAINTMVPEKQRQGMYDKLAKISALYKGNDLDRFGVQQAADMAGLIARKQQLQEDIKKAPMDDALKGAIGDKREQEIVAIDKRLAEIASKDAEANVEGGEKQREAAKEPPGPAVTKFDEILSNEDVNDQADGGADAAPGKTGTPEAAADTGDTAGVPPAPEPSAEPVAKPAPKKKAARKKSTPEDIATQRKNMLGALDGIRKVLSDLGVPLDVASVKQGYDPIGGVTDLKEANRLLAPFGATIDKSGQVELVTPRGSAKFMPIDIDGIIKDAKLLLSDRTLAETSGLRGSAKTIREKIVADYKGPTGERNMDVAAVRQLLDDAEANVEEARKSGNKKIIAVFEAALDRLKKQYPSVETSAESSDADAMMDEFIARANAGRIESAEEAQAASKDFDDRQAELRKSLTDEEAASGAIDDKMKFGDKLTPEELAYVNENYFRPEGYDFDENGGLVKTETPQAAAQQTSIDQGPAQVKSPLSKGKAEPVEKITETGSDNPDPKKATQVEYKIPGWEGYTTVVRKRPGGWAMYILKDGSDFEIHGKGKEEPTARLAASSGAERLNRNREKVEAMVEKSIKAQEAAKGRGVSEQRPTLPPTITIDGKERSTTNSNGKPIAETEEGVRNFYKWFGDSKVVDEQGRPLVVYHGTRGNFNEFNVEGRGKTEGAGAFFTSSPDVASTYSGVAGGAATMPVYLRLERPLIVDAKGSSWGDLSNAVVLSEDGKETKWTVSSLFGFSNSFTDKLGSKLGGGYDSAILNNLFDMGARVVPKSTRAALENPSSIYIVKDPSQIKSATGNSGAFDPKSPNITQQRPSDKKPVKTGKLRTDRVIAALREVAPNLTVSAPKTPKAYTAELERIGLDGISSSWGVYDPNTNSIFLNPESPDLKQTLMHEAAHPLITALAKNNTELFARFHEDVMAHPDAQKYRDHAAKYKDKSDEIQEAEALAEFLGDAGAGRIKFSRDPESLWQRMVAWFKDVMAALGWDTRSIIDLSNAQDVQQFAAGFAKAVNKGIKITGFTPVDADPMVQLQDDADRLVDGWYSRLDQAVANKGNTQSGADWMKWAEARAKEGALSMEEVKWTGLADFLQGKAKVTPKEVREFLKENRVKVEVVERGGAKDRVKLTWNRVDLDNGGYALASTTGGWTITQAGMGKVDLHGPAGFSERHESEDEAVQAAETPSLTADTKYSQYQLSGGTNYREVLVTLPVRTKTQEVNGRQMKLADTDNTFRSSHFDEPNILVHLRLNDRTGPNGERILFVEELQSDWGQQGKKEGFGRIAPPAGTIERLEADVARLTQEREAIRSEADAYGGVGALKASDPAKFAEIRDRFDAKVQEIVRAESALDDARLNAIPNEEHIPPSAPFVTSTDAWVELGMKQAIRMAAQGGYDKIAWTTGEQQNERYDLSKQVDRIEWNRNTRTGERSVMIEAPSGNTHLSVDDGGIVTNGVGQFDGKRLDEVVGKDMADKIMAEETGDLSGEGLKIGGSGMKGFYDKILPTVAKKVSKKLGGEGVVAEVELGKPKDPLKEVGTHQSIAITQAMRDRVGLGVPLLHRGSTGAPDPVRVREYADALISDGFTPEQAKAYMEAKNVKPEVVDAVVEAMRTAVQPPAPTPPTPPPTAQGGGTTPPTPPTPPPTAQPQPASGSPGGGPTMTPAQVQAVLDKQRADASGRKRSVARSIWEWWVKNFEHKRGVADRILKESGGDLSAVLRAITLKNIAAGASARAKTEFAKYHDAVHGGLSRDEKSLLDDIIMLRRVVSVDERRDRQGRPRVEHPGGITSESARLKLDDIRANDPRRFDMLNDRATSYFTAMGDLLRQTYDAGLITKERYEDLKDDEYSPRRFVHHMIDSEARTSVGGMSITGNGIKSLAEGSDESLFNSSEWLLAAHTASTHKRIYNNAANKALHDHIASLGTDRDNPGVGYVLEDDETPKPGYTRIGSFDGGKPQAVAVMNEVAIPWTSDNQMLRRDAANIIRLVTGGAFKRMAITGVNPAFALTNIPRDMMHVLMLTDTYSDVLPVGLAQMAADIKAVSKDVWGRTGRYKEYIEEGGGMDFLTYQGRPITKGDVSIEEGALDRAMHIAGYINETSELLVRLAIRERGITKRTQAFLDNNGRAPSRQELADIKQQATARAREQMDFSQGGNAAKFIDTFVPYFNAALQGTRVLARTMRTDPKRFAAKVAQLGAFSIALVLYNMRFDEWDDVPDHEKENNFIIFLPFTRKDENGQARRMYIKIPKSQDQRAFSNTFEGMAEYAQSGKFPTKRSVHTYYEALPVKPDFMLDVPLIDAMTTYVTGFDRWRGEPLSRRRAEVEPWKEYSPGKTEQFYRDIGMLTSRVDGDGDRVGGVSPERLKAAVGKYSGLSEGNLFHEMFQKNYDLISSAMGREGAKEFDKSMMEHVEEITYPFTRRMTGWSDPAKTRDNALERYSVKEATRRELLNDQVKEGLKTYRKAKNDQERAHADVAMQKVIDAMPEADRKRAADRYKTGRKQTGVDYAIIDIKYEPVMAVRVLAFMDHMDQLSEEERKKADDDARKIGLYTDAFLKEYARLKATREASEQRGR